MNQPNRPAVSLCIPTWRKPEGLRRLLEHVARLEAPGPLTIVVLDRSDEGRTGEAATQGASSQFPFPLVRRVETPGSRGLGDRAAWSAACAEPGADFVAVLTQDEFPAPRWLAEMVGTAVRYHADVVGGPVFPRFEDPRHWLAKSGLYAPRRFVSGPVDAIEGGVPLLIRRDALAPYLAGPVSEGLGSGGGGHREFLARCRSDGRRFAWADDARLWKTVPPAQATVRWLLTRAFRSGIETPGRERSAAGGSDNATRRWSKGLGLVALGLGLLPLAALRGRAAAIRSLVVAARGFGHIASRLGLP